MVGYSLNSVFDFLIKNMLRNENTIIDICEGDFDPDGDVDGADLIAYIADQTTISLADFAGDFGRTDCQSPD